MNKTLILVLLAAVLVVPSTGTMSTFASPDCDASYPDVCIAPSPPDLNCDDIPYKDVNVEGNDPHQLEREGDGVACES